MISRTWRASTERLLFASLLLLGGAARLAALPEGWTVRIDGADVTRAADPVASGEALLIDVAALAPYLGLSVRVAGRAVTIRDPQAGEWQGSAGSSVLTGPQGDVPIARPVRIDNRSVYLPAATAAALAGLVLSVDRDARSVVFARNAGAAIPGGVAPPGWTSFTVAKAPGSYQPSSPPVYGSGLPTVLPPSHDNLRLSTTAGHASSGGSTFDLNGAGEVRGFDTQLGGLVAQGSQGAQLVNGFLHVYQPQGFGVEAGDLFSEIWGSAQGVRLVGREGEMGGSRPALSLYVPDGQTGLRQTVLAGRQELGFGRATTLTGEAASDGSWLLRARYKRDGFGFFAYGREAAGAGPGAGAESFVELPAGVTVNAGWNRSGRGSSAIDGGNLSLHALLLRRVDVSLEATSLRTDRTRLSSEAVSFAAPLGPVLLRARYQMQNGSSLLAGGGRSPIGQRDLLASLAYSPGKRLRFSLTGMSRSPLQGATDRWAQLGVAWQVLPTTSLQILATSSGASFRDPLHLRLEQILGHDLSLLLEYGSFASFQADGGPDTPARWKISVRKLWDVPTPPGGGSVQGRISTSVGRLGSDLPVELGPYRAKTDAKGGFAFRNVPPGSYPLSVSPRAMPAAYSAPAAEMVTVAARKTRRIDLPFVALGTVSGRVAVDRGDGGPAVGMAGVVLHLDDLVTATGPDGGFEFHNLKPGTHRLSIDVDRLPANVGVTVPSSLSVGLPPGGRLDHVELRLVPREKPIVFQEISR